MVYFGVKISVASNSCTILFRNPIGYAVEMNCLDSAQSHGVVSSSAKYISKVPCFLVSSVLSSTAFSLITATIQ